MREAARCSSIARCSVGHGIEIGQAQRVNEFPEAVQAAASSQLNALNDIIRWVLKLDREFDALFREVIDLAVLGQ